VNERLDLLPAAEQQALRMTGADLAAALMA
jgi:hypothetical protein